MYIRSILDRHLGWHLIYIFVDIHSRVNLFLLTSHRVIQVKQHSVNYELAVGWVSVEYRRLAWVASVSVGLVLPTWKMVREPNRGKRGRGRKETLADKPLDFENNLLDLSCLSAHTKISCCHRLSEFSRTCQDMSKTTSKISKLDSTRLKVRTSRVKF